MLLPYSTAPKRAFSPFPYTFPPLFVHYLDFSLYRYILYFGKLMQCSRVKLIFTISFSERNVKRELKSQAEITWEH